VFFGRMLTAIPADDLSEIFGPCPEDVHRLCMVVHDVDTDDVAKLWTVVPALNFKIRHAVYIGLSRRLRKTIRAEHQLRSRKWNGEWSRRG